MIFGRRTVEEWNALLLDHRDVSPSIEQPRGALPEASFVDAGDEGVGKNVASDHVPSDKCRSWASIARGNERHDVMADVMVHSHGDGNAVEGQVLPRNETGQSGDFDEDPVAEIRKDNRPTWLRPLFDEHGERRGAALPPDVRTYFPRGFVNIGNTCFINVIAQVLLACVPFRELMLQVGASPEHEHPLNRAPLLAKFSRLVKEVVARPGELEKLESAKQRERAWLNRESLRPDYLYEAVEHSVVAEMMNRGSQEDAQEFLTHVLNALHEEFIKLGKVVMADATLANGGDNQEWEETGTSGGHGRADAADVEGWEEVGRKGRGAVHIRSTAVLQQSAVTEIFGGVMRSELRWPNSKPSVTREPFMCLQLEIGDRKIRSLEDALQLYFEPETVEGYRSELTREAVEARKHFMIESSPHVLIVHLKRFSYNPETLQPAKVSKRISYPERLTLSPTLFSTVRTSAQHGQNRSYRLFAVVIHHGVEVAGGHYTCDVFQGTEWVACDDSRLSRASSDAVLKRQPYLLFYQQVSG
ncbi:Ubiquitin carboxyl-terminal hydrolase 10 [Porphyridium purpureum]|uniref:ubiquitinyl hydrolase 1 n=1 Tax=Porphyridium purpureum TaxID=35688 RepID=A0A5J4YTD4_PORPP|nr:Ubiquitin carboxyl-terminal hydrolase 10 [Porphyridium purpureum]|eukprot:POR3216..scf229_5